MTLNRPLLLLAAALACAILALLTALGVTVAGASFSDWLAGSLVSYFGSLLP